MSRKQRREHRTAYLERVTERTQPARLVENLVWAVQRDSEARKARGINRRRVFHRALAEGFGLDTAVVELTKYSMKVN